MSRKSQEESTLSKFFLLILALVFLGLIVVTLGVVAIFVGDSLPEGIDTYFITAKEPSFKTEDGETKKEWKDTIDVSIFQTSYENGEKLTTVLSQTGDKIIAPGTISTYDFCICNEGNVAIAYDLNFSFLFSIEGMQMDVGTFPLLIRLRRNASEYLVGGKDSWVAIQSDKLGEYKGILGVNSYEHFILEIQWAFEGNDIMDTVLGNTSVDVPVSLHFEIDSTAQEHFDPKAKGGIQLKDSTFSGDYGGTIRWETFIPLIIVLVLVLLLLIAFI